MRPASTTLPSLLSLLGALGAAAITAACGEAAIEMRLELPPAEQAGFDVSCVTAVEVIVRGTERGRLPEGPSDPGQPPDDIDDCIEISDVHSYGEVRREIAGRFALALPESGLAGVDVRGSTGTCKKDNAPGDPVFYAAAAYKGGDELVLPMVPNLSCAGTRAEAVRPVDLLALTRTGQCPALLPDNSGTVYAGTIHPSALDKAVFDSGDELRSIVGNVANLQLYVTTTESSCIALGYGDNNFVMTTASCARRAAGVCTTGNQVELPIIDGNAAIQTVNIGTVDEYGGAVIGGVWGTDATGTKIRLAGATIKPARPADAELAKVVYADYPAGAASPRELAGAASTNATGLFIAYVGRPIDFVVSAPGYRDETVRMGSPNDPSTALILLTKR